MAKNLVIVESPAKAKTIQRFLGDDYTVMSSYGHIRDLHKKDFSIDVDHGFEPIYEIPEDKREVVRKLRAAADKADVVWLASDEDREGEAIAWHLREVLQLKPERTRRIVFHEITKPAILEAIKHPRDIDVNLVDAQQARRVLDRIVGFELSPVLWKKIKPALSAGRVQSVAVRLIAEREREIQAFKSESYYRVTATMGPESLLDTLTFAAHLNRNLPDAATARALLEHCKAGCRYTVTDVTVKPMRKSPAPPFTTSTLQQEAARKLGFSVSQTMRVAQALYEAGHITYMRTDSVNLSSLAIGAISKEIEQSLGKTYLRVRKFHTTSKGAQEAHEAIRPTYIATRAIEGTVQEKRLYDLIYKRTLASQMADAEVERTTIDIAIEGRDEHFVAEGETIKFDGFLRMYIESNDDVAQDTPMAGKDGEMNILPSLSKGDSLGATVVTATQRFTQHQPRYSEASLVRRLEELGIGRPSTYAPTISTIQQREYVAKGENKGEKRPYEVITLSGTRITTSIKTETVGMDKGRLVPTDTGLVVNDFLMRYFPKIMDYNFTAQVEQSFDEIAAGHDTWSDDIAAFYDDFHPTVQSVSTMRLEHKVGERQLGNDPATGKPVSVKIGRFGPLVQLGSSDGDEKPRFASLQKGQSVGTITLKEALKLFELPRILGDYEDKEVSVAVGRFGPYVKHDGKYVSVPATIAPTELTLEQAIELINSKREGDAKKVIATWDEEPDLQVLNGRFGPYIVYKGTNYKIPRKTDAATLTLDDCRAIVADEANASRPKARRGRK